MKADLSSLPLPGSSGAVADILDRVESRNDMAERLAATYTDFAAPGSPSKNPDFAMDQSVSEWGVS